MCKSEIFFNLLGLTERETEVPKERILGDFRDMESTDARYVLVRLLSEAGLYPDQIAGMTNRTARGIRHLLARNITSPMIGIYLEQISNISVFNTPTQHFVSCINEFFTF